MRAASQNVRNKCSFMLHESNTKARKEFANLNKLNVLGMADMMKSDEKMHTHPPCADMNLPMFEHKDVPTTGCHPVTNSLLTPVTYCVLSCLSPCFYRSLFDSLTS